MSDLETLSERLAAVERAVTGGKEDLTTLEERAALADELDSLDQRVRDIEERVADLEAATQAVRGYVGSVRAVNEEVEARADAALAGVEAIERSYDDEHVRGSFWTADTPPANPNDGEGWRDVAMRDPTDETDGLDGDESVPRQPREVRNEESQKALTREGEDACEEGKGHGDETDRGAGELRAAVRRLGEAL